MGCGGITFYNSLLRATLPCKPFPISPFILLLFTHLRMLIKRGLQPVFLRRCLQRTAAAQKNRWTSPKCEAESEPVETCYVRRPTATKPKKTSTVVKKPAIKDEPVKVAKKKSETKTVAPPALPSPSAESKTEAPAPIRPRPRSLLANALPLTPAGPPTQRRASSESIGFLSASVGDAIKRPSEAAVVVHHPQVKRTKKS